MNKIIVIIFLVTYSCTNTKSVCDDIEAKVNLFTKYDYDKFNQYSYKWMRDKGIDYVVYKKKSRGYSVVNIEDKPIILKKSINHEIDDSMAYLMKALAVDEFSYCNDTLILTVIKDSVSYILKGNWNNYKFERLECSN